MFPLIRENINIALGSIRSQSLRAILTILIIAIGITALVGILSAVNALENTISGNFSSIGANTFRIQRYEYATRHQSGNKNQQINPIITYGQAIDFIERYQFPFTQTAVSFYGTQNAELKYNNKKTDPEITVIGVNEHYVQNSGLSVNEGREFSSVDIQKNTNLCIIGSDVKKALFEDSNPIGKVLSVRGVKFTVIGVLKSKGALFGNNQDLRVLLPINRARAIFSYPNINYSISIKADNKDMLTGAQDEAIAAFRDIRGLHPLEDNNFGISLSDDLINRISEMSTYLLIVAWIISIITVFGSSIALMNIMLVSVTERTREIGVRKALGAKQKTIAFQFFAETIIIGQLGGILGIILGVLIGLTVSLALKFNFTTPWGAMIWATAISFIVAIISGLYPAIKASKLNPIEALRHE